MIRICFCLMVVFTVFCTARVSSAEIDTFNPKNYVYDDEGNPLFVKVYLKARAESLSQSGRAVSIPSQENDIQILKLMMQEDQRGSFLVIPIKKKKSNDDEDKDESNWECPYCHKINPASRNSCSNPECPLNRKAWKDW